MMTVQNSGVFATLGGRCDAHTFLLTSFPTLLPTHVVPLVPRSHFSAHVRLWRPQYWGEAGHFRIQRGVDTLSIERCALLLTYSALAPRPRTRTIASNACPLSLAPAHLTCCSLCGDQHGLVGDRRSFHDNELPLFRGREQLPGPGSNREADGRFGQPLRARVAWRIQGRSPLSRR